MSNLLLKNLQKQYENCFNDFFNFCEKSNPSFSVNELKDLFAKYHGKIEKPKENLVEEKKDLEDFNLEVLDLEVDLEPGSEWAKKIKIPKLKEILKTFNLPSTGNKASLLQELKHYLLAQKNITPKDSPQEPKIKIQNKLTKPKQKSQKKTVNIYGYNCIHDKQNNIYFVLNDKKVVIGYIPGESVEDENVHVIPLTKRLVVLAQNLKLEIDLFNINLDVDGSDNEDVVENNEVDKFDGSDNEIEKDEE